MSILRPLLGATTIVLAGAAVAGKIARDKQQKAELDEFLVPEQDDGADIEINEESNDLSKAIFALENHEPRTIFFVFDVENKDTAHQLQAMAAEYEMGSSYDSDDQTVEVEYKGNFDVDDLNTLNTQLAELCRQTGAVFKTSHD